MRTTPLSLRSQIFPRRLRRHPRLIALASDIERVEKIITLEPLARKWRDRLQEEAERILGEPPVAHRLVGRRRRMLLQSRTALDRIYTLALLYRLDGDRRFAARARRELLAVAVFPDWNPSHFLDTAEMTHAVAIGYDWLHSFLSPQDRVLLRGALVNLGLKPSLKLYDAHRSWVVVTHNWNQVCNAGMVLGALAVADEEPDLAACVVANATTSIKRAIAKYAPDGGWPEGPAYWNYATSYTTYLLASLHTALGMDFGLSEMDGLAETGNFRLHITGPLGRTFNFADSNSEEEGAPMLFWLARCFDRPSYAWSERQIRVQPSALDLLWFDPRGQGPRAERTPTDALFRSVDVATFRSTWEDANAVFVGFKGGNNRANHSHLDLGTFVLDAEGQRWAVDLGPDDYNLLGYFGNKRFTYYRLRTEGHNTLTLNGKNQNPAARAPIVGFSSTRSRACAVADLSAAYRSQTRHVSRGIALLQRQHVLVQDEIEGDRPFEAVWGMHTPGEIQVDGTHAKLRLQDVHLFARILEPAGAHFEALAANPPRPQAQNHGFQKLIVRLPEKVSRTRIVVMLSPSRTDAAPVFTPEVRPLSSWTSE